MKKLFMMGAVALFGLSNAQINKGTVYLSGQLTYAHEKDNNAGSKKDDFTIIPTAGLFVAPNVAVGTGIGYTESKFILERVDHMQYAIFTNYEASKLSAFKVAPFVRKYWSLSDKLFIFGQLEVPMEFGKAQSEFKYTYTDNVYGGSSYQQMSAGSKYTVIGVNVKPGMDYFLDKNWSVEATLGEFGYSNFKLKDADKGINTYNLGVNLASVGIGIKYVFAK